MMNIEIRQEIKKVFETIPDLLIDEKFDQVKEIFENLDKENLHANVLYAYLSASNPWKEHLTIPRHDLLIITHNKLIKYLGVDRARCLIQMVS
jgi:hypothetical protein